MSGEFYLGLMSGTSMDGIDCALVEFTNDTPRLRGFSSTPWDADLRQLLRSLTTPGNDEIEHLGQADIRVADAFADAVLKLIDSYAIKPEQIRAIGSHGQTIRHRPDRPTPFTLQIGDPNQLAERTGITVVADFRRRDMAAHGQGAPLVPAFHAAMFQTPDEERVILNIGGIANITHLPADPQGKIIGFDTGPGNILIDHWIQKIRRLDYDAGGEWAAQGQAAQKLLLQMLRDPFFNQAPPKSTGPEYFSQEWLEMQLQGWTLDPVDVQATLTELTCFSIVSAIKRYCKESRRIIVCGGGAHNQRLMQGLSAGLTGMIVETTDSHGLHPDQVEAAAFAWLARQTMNRRPGNLPSVTGASHPVILGGIYSAP